MVDPTVLDENNKTVILTSMTVKNYLGLFCCQKNNLLNVLHVTIISLRLYILYISGKPTLGSTTATYVYTNLDIAEGNELIRR